MDLPSSPAGRHRHRDDRAPDDARNFDAPHLDRDPEATDPDDARDIDVTDIDVTDGDAADRDAADRDAADPDAADRDPDAAPGDGRTETASQRADRNWNELLQEFRVFQTGTQIVAAFLLTLPFQQRFTELAPFDVGLYIVLVLLAVIITLLALAPVALHRLLFRRRMKERLVAYGSRLLIVCLAAASLLFTGIVLFIVDFLLTPGAGAAIAAAVFAVVLALWIVVPLLIRRRSQIAGEGGRNPGST